MSKAYKLTKSDLTCRNGFQYTVDVRAEVEYTGALCTSGVLHCYDSPEDAVFFDPIHAELLPGGRLWECEYDGPSTTDGTKRGVGNLTLLREVPIPQMSTEQRVERGISAALSVSRSDSFRGWAERWSSGDDRSEK